MAHGLLLGMQAHGALGEEEGDRGNEHNFAPARQA